MLQMAKKKQKTYCSTIANSPQPYQHSATIIPFRKTAISYKFSKGLWQHCWSIVSIVRGLFFSLPLAKQYAVFDTACGVVPQLLCWSSYLCRALLVRRAGLSRVQRNRALLRKGHPDVPKKDGGIGSLAPEIEELASSYSTVIQDDTVEFTHNNTAYNMLDIATKRLVTIRFGIAPTEK